MATPPLRWLNYSVPNSVDLEGRGAGMGRYQGKSLAEIRTTFDRCRQDPSMRSVTAVLRIAREQLDARGSLGSYPYIAAGLAVCTVVSAVAIRAIPNLPEQTKGIDVGFAALTAIVLFGVWHARHERRAGMAQEREIRRLAADALMEILDHDFRRKPLEREHIQTLQDLIKREPRPGLEKLLEDGS